MISNSWNKAEGESITQKVMGKVRPDEPLKNKIDFAQRKLQFQISKLESINSKLQKKHDTIFEKIVNAQKNNKNGYAHAYAGELAQVRKMKNMVSGAKLSMEQVKLRLDTVSELGDIVVTLSPCMSIIKGLSPSLSGIMPEANASMQDLSQILGDVMSGSSVNMDESLNMGVETNADTLAILDEAQGVIAGNAKSSIPDIPDSLKQSVTADPVRSTVPDIPDSLKQSVTADPVRSTVPDIPDSLKQSVTADPVRSTVPDIPDSLKQSVTADPVRSTVPDIPDSLKHQIVEKKSDIFI